MPKPDHHQIKHISTEPQSWLFVNWSERKTHPLPRHTILQTTSSTLRSASPTMLSCHTCSRDKYYTQNQCIGWGLASAGNINTEPSSKGSLLWHYKSLEFFALHQQKEQPDDPITSVAMMLLTQWISWSIEYIKKKYRKPIRGHFWNTQRCPD